MILLPKRRDPRVESEEGQASFRLYAALTSLLVYLAAAFVVPTLVGRLQLVCVFSYVAYAYFWSWAVALGVGSELVRQNSALILDHSVFGVCFALGGPPVAALAWVSVTTSVGHGLRFGTARGVAAAVAGSLAIGLAVSLGSSWHLDPLICVGLAMTALISPIYVTRLARAIQAQRLEAETRAKTLELTAQTDALTGVLSRRGFDAVWEALSSEQTSSNAGNGLVYIDLDGFKTVNDTYGHDAGDEVLREVAQILVGIVRGGDAVARLGGDEFAIIVKNAASEAAVVRVAEKVAAAVRECKHPAAQFARLSASAGVAMVPPGAAAAEALKLADIRMFDVKRQTKQAARLLSQPASST